MASGPPTRLTMLNIYWVTRYDRKNNTLPDSIIIVFETSLVISPCPGAINIGNWKCEKSIINFFKKNTAVLYPEPLASSRAGLPTADRLV
jgi:hypothetical protein